VRYNPKSLAKHIKIFSYIFNALAAYCSVFSGFLRAKLNYPVSLEEFGLFFI
jgi:hypothetical protein